MERRSAISAYLRRAAASLATLPARAKAAAWGLLRDDATRPATLYLLALTLAAASFGAFLLGGGGRPTKAEFGLQVGSFGVLFYMSLRQAGGGGGGRVG